MLKTRMSVGSYLKSGIAGSLKFKSYNVFRVFAVCSNDYRIRTTSERAILIALGARSECKSNHLLNVYALKVYE